jgi:tRNA threonylcarbamoyladenosine biosynthesis protein TsaB
VLAFDAASPVASAAVALDGRRLAERFRAETRSSDLLLALIDGVLADAGVDRGDLGGVVALRGPGSFTGARVALATALGLRLGGVPRATAASTLEALALAAPAESPRCLALVDALRGEWFAQPFVRSGGGEPTALGEPRLASPAGLAAGDAPWIGFGAARLAASRPGVAIHEPPPLAAAVAEAASRGRWAWDEERLAQPLYLRPPAASPPAR